MVSNSNFFFFSRYSTDAMFFDYFTALLQIAGPRQSLGLSPITQMVSSTQLSHLKHAMDFFKNIKARKASEMSNAVLEPLPAICPTLNSEVITAYHCRFSARPDPLSKERAPHHRRHPTPSVIGCPQMNSSSRSASLAPTVYITTISFSHPPFLLICSSCCSVL